jgi:hypothetical protein
MTDLAARIRCERPLPKGRSGVAILFASALIAGACLAPVAASAGDAGEGDAGAAAVRPGVGAAGGDKGADSAVDGVAPPAAEHGSDAAADDKGVVDQIESALASARHWMAARPLQPHPDARKAKSPAASAAAPLPRPLRWLMRYASGSLARAAGVARKVGGAALGAPLAWLDARVHVSTSDQDSAREAVKKGQIVPLASILKTIQGSVPGDVLKVALVRDVKGSWSYSITVLTPQGYYRDVNVDAGSNEITQIKGH